MNQRVATEQEKFAQWFAQISELSDAQAGLVAAAVDGQSAEQASVAIIERGIGDDRTCPHCDTPGAVSHGKARGLQRFRCKSCRRTFNALTGTPLSGLHHKGRWLSFGESLARRESVADSSKRCRIAPSTAFRWRHRFIRAAQAAPEKLRGIVEADECHHLESEKGSHNLTRPARRRGGTAAKPGRSAEQLPILFAVARAGGTFSQALPNASAATLVACLKPVIDPDSLLITDGYSAYPPCAEALGVRHEAVNLSAGIRARGMVHVQTANNRHSQWKEFLLPFRGVSTRYLGNYLRLFHLTILERKSTAHACLAATVSGPSTRFA